MSMEETGETTKPLDIAAIMRSTVETIHAAGNGVIAGNREITERVIEHSENNAKQVFETLDALSKTKDPAQFAKIYGDFVAKSAQLHAKQLLDIGASLSSISKDTWAPVSRALKKATSNI